jgi:hypothetical protein
VKEAKHHVVELSEVMGTIKWLVTTPFDFLFYRVKCRNWSV